MDWWLTVLTTVLGFLGGIGGYRLISNWLALRAGNYEIDRTKRADAMVELQDIIEQKKAEARRKQEELDRLQERYEAKDRDHSDCQIRLARLETWADGVVDVATAAGIRIRPLPRLDIPPVQPED